MMFTATESPVRSQGWRPPASQSEGPLLVQLSVHTELDALENEWLAFQARAQGTIYQTYQWCRAWVDTAGLSRQVEPRIVVGREANGRLLFILPFGLRKAYGLRTLEWYTGRQCNYGYGLYDRGFLRRARSWFASEGWRILALAGPADALDLADMPEIWKGKPHPLSAWFSLAGPNVSYQLQLLKDYEALYAAKRSGETRRGNRKRDARLEKEGSVDFGLPQSRAQAHARLDEMFRQHENRLAENGVYGVFGEAERAFIHRLVDLPDHMQPILLPYHLTIDDEMEAMMLGGHYGGGYWALIASLGTSSSRRYSPGDAALRRTIEACCKRDLTFFDFSSGSSAYKLHWADEAISLHYALRGMTFKGYLWALGRMAAIAAKRQIKQSPQLWGIASRIRRQFGSRPA